ncbi:Type I restriction-modification system, S subunit/Type I restriction modification DNA specificity [Actinobacillus minor NM305]|uniref:Type I restriction-modification system, S subunit/Type I restriction modification DNA specificity n=1 Tax=Actinobacillus minor NM305 TaxID=637911 RepID=C5S288_9PAST|nr:restriction endonuclease subunit S [Actinobacillus minor]EER47015.1 Type I restriction-modification system, S subunit/Type I restriction modification DNA specificity [Actinobacillus minor NM305]
MSSWELKKLSEVADIIGGATPKSDVDEYFNGDIPWITPKDLSGYKNRYISKGERNITKLGLENSSAKLLPKGAVLFTSRAPIGYVAIADNEVSTNQGFKSLVLKDGNIPEFFYYLLKHNIPLFEARATGSTFKEVSGQVVKNTELLIPSIDIQKKIVDLVSPLDEKIELNTQINQTLEQIAQTIFKSWFIDFDPVHAKANALASGQTTEQATQAAMAVISGKNTQELHRLQTANPEQYQQLWEIAEAFPSGFDEEGVPRGWGLSTIDENYNVVMGQSPKGETYNEESNGALFYQGRAEFGWRYPEPRLYTTDPKRMAKKGNILMSVRAPVGDLNVALEDCCIGRGLAALSHKSNSLSFGLYQIKNLQNEFDIFNGEGTVFGSINQKDLKAIKVINPSFKIIKLFDDVCSSNELQIENLSREIIFLRKIRDELLPKLLSGEKKYVCK